VTCKRVRASTHACALVCRRVYMLSPVCAFWGVGRRWLGLEGPQGGDAMGARSRAFAAAADALRWPLGAWLVAARE
jgi:hypothetical protein